MRPWRDKYCAHFGRSILGSDARSEPAHAMHLSLTSSVVLAPKPRVSAQKCGLIEIMLVRLNTSQTQPRLLPQPRVTSRWTVELTTPGSMGEITTCGMTFPSSPAALQQVVSHLSGGGISYWDLVNRHNLVPLVSLRPGGVLPGCSTAEPHQIQKKQHWAGPENISVYLNLRKNDVSFSAGTPYPSHYSYDR